MLCDVTDHVNKIATVYCIRRGASPSDFGVCTWRAIRLSHHTSGRLLLIIGKILNTNRVAAFTLVLLVEIIQFAKQNKNNFISIEFS